MQPRIEHGIQISYRKFSENVIYITIIGVHKIFFGSTVLTFDRKQNLTVLAGALLAINNSPSTQVGSEEALM